MPAFIRYALLMQLTEEQINGFIKAYEQDFGETPSRDEAREMASRVVELYLLLSEADPSEVEAMRNGTYVFPDDTMQLAAGLEVDPLQTPQ